MTGRSLAAGVAALAAGLGAASWLIPFAPASTVTHIDSRFDSGHNRHHWRTARTGTCSEGTSSAATDRFRYRFRPKPEELARDELFHAGHFDLRAVSGDSRAPHPDECAVFLFTVAGSSNGVAYNGGPPEGDIEAEVVFRLKTGTTVLTSLIAFGGKRWRYIALMIPASEIATVPYMAPGRIGLMKPRVDLEGDNPPLLAGTTATIRIDYTRASDTVAVRLNGRRLRFASILGGGARPFLVPERVHEVDDITEHKPFRSRGAVFQLYSEAQLDARADSAVEILSARLVSRRQRPLVEALRRASFAAARPFLRAEFEVRYAFGRLRRRLSRIGRG